MACELKCPLCCTQKFNSKASLIEHLSKYEKNIKCSICNSMFTSLPNLLNHLNKEGCEAQKERIEKQQTSFASCSTFQANPSNIEDSITSPTQLMTEFDEDANQIYIELMKRPLLQDFDENNKMQLLTDNGQANEYVVMSQDGVVLSLDKYVTKQNSDGTISITSAEQEKAETSPKFEQDTVISGCKSEAESTLGREEFYSCNTCGITFSSVLEHIQSFHKNEDIILENTSQALELDTLLNGQCEKTNSALSKEETKSNVDTQFITVDTGFIVKSDAKNPNNNVSNKLRDVVEEVVDKNGKTFNRRYKPIDKSGKEKILAPSPKPSPKPRKSKVPFHQVIAKNILSLQGENTKVYYCISCQIYVSEIKEFQNHPCKTLKYPCKLCPASFQSPDTRKLHYNDEHSDVIEADTLKLTLTADSERAVIKGSPKRKAPTVLNAPDFNTNFKCDDCGTVFPTNKSLKLHRRMHDPIQAKPIEHPVELNLDGTAAAEETYLCTVCNKNIPTSYRMIHTNSHKDCETFHCDTCNKKFSSNEYLVMHMKVHQTDKVIKQNKDKVLPYSCLYCTRQFARPHEKVKHERIHTGEKPHSCEICGKTFRVSYCLTLHMRTHTGARPYACQFCGKRFKAHSVYNHHLMTHSDVRAYKCPFCPKAFKTSVQLAGHKNSHTKPFSCKQCNRPFASLYAVRCHTETHRRHNNLKFNCARCGASYARSFALQDHMKQAHGKTDAVKSEAETTPVIEDVPVTDNFSISWEDASVTLKTDIPSPSTISVFDPTQHDGEEIIVS